MSVKLNLRFGILVAIIFLAALSRLMPHLQNFSPVCALGLFGAAHFEQKWKAFLIPLAATFLSDIILSQWIHTNQPFLYKGIEWQYLSYVLIVWTGFYIFKKMNLLSVITGVGTSTLLFYFVTNLGCWPGNPIYTQDLRGMIDCLLAGLPFVKGTILSNVFYTTLLFGGYYLMERRFQFLRPSVSYG